MVRAEPSDIAEQLGISTSTVSRALSDHVGISEATKERVRQAAQQ
ncbi:MAG: LacI family DNA-binding transcriptional regulator, partial [Verrucomicrobiaceae bacterium]